MAGKLFHRLVLLAAAVMFAVPAASLPCLSADCGRDAADDSGSMRSCCAGCVSSTPEGSGRHDERDRPSRGGPCNCPPECPASCGAGKLPCPPVESIHTTAAMTPAGVLTCPTTVPPADVRPDGVFHPPRV